MAARIESRLFIGTWEGDQGTRDALGFEEGDRWISMPIDRVVSAEPDERFRISAGQEILVHKGDHVLAIPATGDRREYKFLHGLLPAGKIVAQGTDGQMFELVNLTGGSGMPNDTCVAPTAPDEVSQRARDSRVIDTFDVVSTCNCPPDTHYPWCFDSETITNAIDGAVLLAVQQAGYARHIRGDHFEWLDPDCNTIDTVRFEEQDNNFVIPKRVRDHFITHHNQED